MTDARTDRRAPRATCLETTVDTAAANAPATVLTVRP